MAATWSPDMVVLDEFGGHDIRKHFSSRCQEFDIASCTPGTWANHDFSYPIPVVMFAAQLIGNSDIENDELEFHIAPDTDVGDINADISSSASFVPVTDDTQDVAEVGYFIALDDGTNRDELGMILYKDNNQLAVETATTNSFAAATPTEILVTNKMIPWCRLPGSSRLVVGGNKIGGTYIPANTTMRIRYRNNDGVAKKFNFYLEYMY